MENQKYRTMHAVTLGQANNKSANAKPIPAPRNIQFVNSGFRQPPQAPPEIAHSKTNKSHSLRTTTTSDSNDNLLCHDNTTQTNTDHNSSHPPGQ
ncbi:hypothetical protein ACLKA6_001078 [Drosophila palustris]